MYCLETSFIINLLRNKKEAVSKYNQIEGQTLYTTSITAFEILRLGKDVEKLKSLFNKTIVLDFGYVEVLEAIKIERELKRKGRMINIFDILIASIVTANNLVLITSNKDFRKVSGLKAEFAG